MGATVSTGKLVGAFLGSKGTPVYVLFEESYSKNVHPHKPRWCAQLIGDLEAVVRVIFESGSSCEGGMLQGAGGRTITPEGYISGWLKALENPVSMHDREFELKVGDSYSSPIPRGDFERVKAAMVQLGEHEKAAQLEAGETVLLTLHGDSELLSVIFNGSNAGAWRIIPSYDTPVHGICNSSLGYAPKKTKAFQVATPRFYKVAKDEDNVLIQGTDSNWQCAGWAYSCVAKYVSDLWQAELREPGSFRTRVKAYRDGIVCAPIIPEDAVVVVDTSIPLQTYQQKNVENLLASVDHKRVGSDVHIKVSAALDKLYELTRLPSACSKWVISEQTPMEQFSLLTG